jgi:predicted MPP superfamily phosphohydrolase
VIGHGPDFVLNLAGTGLVDLALAGHTHGGQVVLPFIGAPYTKTRIDRRYASGLNDYAGIPIHVSAGIGMERGTAPQIRFLCPPEISVLDVSY